MTVAGRDASDGDDGRRDLEREMKGVKPLRGKREVLPPKAPTPKRAGGGTRDERVAFDVKKLGERVEGQVPGIDRRTLQRFRSGDFPVESAVDLHGFEAAAARRAVRKLLDTAWREGQRCVQVIHGRGAHSEGGPVLKHALPKWLAEDPVGPRVLAFASAPAGQGGAGATLVLLRRQR